MFIGQVYRSKRLPDSDHRMTIIDLSEDLQFVKFKCTFCDLVHECAVENFLFIALPIS